ncbi:hypothetical protein [Donghicola eburneus]|uniref:Uncharacterized protein n=1 Tax=Donghicola eburneus TaxID=393278 RepID=A0A1M4N5X4_9RHOB|nr:hypothetical protein [Donghicola eburneus]SCM69434.1 hypothetical protein KARMA_3673 [Donghicola eburneus]
MPFKPHPELENLQRIWPNIEEYQQLAEKYGIDDIFQDNNGKLLYVLLKLGLTNLSERAGNDAIDESGREYELKSLNIGRKKNSNKKNNNDFTTHHHLNISILNKYRNVDWIFALYDNIHIISIHLMKPEGLERYFSHWENRLLNEDRDYLNNPKISRRFVLANSTLLYDKKLKEA